MDLNSLLVGERLIPGDGSMHELLRRSPEVEFCRWLLRDQPGAHGSDRRTDYD